MFKIQTINKISPKGLELFPRDNYEIASEIMNPDAIIVRSQNMLEMEIPATVQAIARAGAGVNNIPINTCTEKGIVVFNTPGANANAVKELVLLGMFMSSRKIAAALQWIQGQKGKGEEIPQLVEKGKSSFKGSELQGKKLGVIGLGAIGVMIANDALSLGMQVSGYDPFISVENAWGLSREVGKCMSLDQLLADSDYVTVHVPLNDATRGMFNKEKFDLMKEQTTLLNFARGGLVNNADLAKAVENGKIARYVTDFPDENLLSMEQVICLPHLGASTAEAEENCARMAVEQLRDFLETGNIKNSVNFPECELPFLTNHRLVIANKNIPNMVGQITTVLAQAEINISDMINKHKNNLAYNIIDVDGELCEDCLDALKSIEGVIMARCYAKSQ